VARNVVHEQARGDRRRARVEKRHTRKLQVGVDLPTKDELRAMLEHAGRLRPLLVTAVFTGLRASELRGLAWDAVDLERRVLTVRQRADRWDVLGSPKSDAGKREVPLAPIVVNTLREWRLTCPRFAGDGERRLRFVFPDSDGNVESHHNIHRSTGLGRVQESLARPTPPM
jgi:integrase